MSTSDRKSSTVNFSHCPSFCLDLRENKAAYIHKKAPGMAVKIKIDAAAEHWPSFSCRKSPETGLANVSEVGGCSPNRILYPLGQK